MGTMWGSDDKYIFDDSVLDMAWKFAPKDKKVAKLSRKIRDRDVNGKWRGLVLMYEAFRSYGWEPNREMVIIESELALKNMGMSWKEPEEAKERIIKMRDHMLNPHGKKQPSPVINCPFCSVGGESAQMQIEFVDGNPPCLICNGTHQVDRTKLVDCPFCDEPYVEKYKQIGELKVKMIPCQMCEGTHKMTVGDLEYENVNNQDNDFT